MKMSAGFFILFFLLAGVLGEEETLDVETREIIRTCTQSSKMDMQIIVDSSMSVGQDQFTTMMEKISDNLVHQFAIGKDATRVAVFKYSGDHVMANEIGLGDFNTAPALEAAIKSVKYAPGWTQTAKAMQESLKYYRSRVRDGKETAKVCIIFTDGQANDAKQIPAATKQWEQIGAKVYAVGIGEGIDRKGLDVIAGSDDRVLQVANFKAIGDIAKSLLKKVCKETILPHPCDTKEKGGCEQLCIKKGEQAACGCKNGFKLSSNLKSCEKVHLCDTKNNGGCEQICHKEGNHALCDCKDGFKLAADQKRCVKIHPCDLAAKGGCQQICKKSGVKAVCACNAVFKLAANEKSCVKVHPCDTPAKGGCRQICKKSGDNAVCTCQAGFKLAADKKSCHKANPCDGKGCKHNCLKFGDQAVCSCRRGFQLSGNGKTCQQIRNCKWYCAVTQNRGVVGRTTYLREAQRKLGGGNQNNRQAIIPMTDRNPGDPHTLPKSWGGGSMWWWDWWDINQMRDKCRGQQPLCKVHPCDDYTRGGCNQICNKAGNSARCSCVGGFVLSPNQKTCVKKGTKPVPAGPLKWFCAVKINGGVRLKTTDLGAAQRVLGRGNQNHRQAIIPMTNRGSGDPHTLAKGWGSGSMWWWGWDDIHKMQAMCRGAGLPG